MACWVNWADTGHHQHRSSWFKKKTAPGFLLCSQFRFFEQRWRWSEFALARPVIQSRSLPLEGLPMVDQVTQVALFVAQIAQIWCEFQTVLSSFEKYHQCTGVVCEGLGLNFIEWSMCWFHFETVDLSEMEESVVQRLEKLRWMWRKGKLRWE